MKIRQRSSGMILLTLYTVAFGFVQFFWFFNAEGQISQGASHYIFGFSSFLLLGLAGGVFFFNNYCRLALVTYFLTLGGMFVAVYSWAIIANLIHFFQPTNDPAGYSRGDHIIWGIAMLILSVVPCFGPAYFLMRSEVKMQFKNSYTKEDVIKERGEAGIQ